MLTKSHHTPAPSQPLPKASPIQAARPGVDGRSSTTSAATASTDSGHSRCGSA
jgi:hypothetical protein